MSYQSFIQSQLYKRKSQNLERLGFNYTTDSELEYFKIQKLLFQEYHIKCESMLTIMKKYDIPSSRTMDILFRLFDIDARSLSIAQTNAFALGRSNVHEHLRFTAKQQWHKTWEGKDVYLRSSYELAYAKELDEKKIRYDTECMRILYFDSKNQKHRVAIPDFYLPDSNTIVEIKSAYWLNEENMKDKSQEYQNLGFKFQLIVDGNLVEAVGFEPTTLRLKGEYSDR